MSSNLRHNAKRDANETEIVAVLLQAGCDVERLNGTRIPDLLVGRAGMNFLLEVKDEHGRLTDGQDEWHRAWRGRCAVVRSPEEALEAVGLG